MSSRISEHAPRLLDALLGVGSSVDAGAACAQVPRVRLVHRACRLGGERPGRAGVEVDQPLGHRQAAANGVDVELRDHSSQVAKIAARAISALKFGRYDWNGR